jgi:hypothetical protein
MRRRAFVYGSVLTLAAPLPSGAQPAWDRRAVYAARQAQVKSAIDTRPGDAQPLVELAAFYLKPLAPRDVEAADGVRRRVMVPLRNEWIVEGIKEIYAVPWVFRGDPDLARPLLKRALEIEPKHSRAMRESAMLLRMKSNLDGMRPYMEAALRRDPMDLDMCRAAPRPPHCCGAGPQRPGGGSPHAANVGGAASRRPLSRDAKPEHGRSCASGRAGQAGSAGPARGGQTAAESRRHPEERPPA